jgi:hypothetical protein
MRHAGVWFFGTLLLLGCGSSSTSDTTDAGNDATPTPDAMSQSDTSTPADSGLDSGADVATNQDVTLAIENATFTNVTGVDKDFYYTVSLTIHNTSSDDVTSLDTLTYDFGNGNQISLTKPACAGKLAIAAGASKSISTEIGVDKTTGAEKSFSIICSPSQYFGGATGMAPATNSFPGPIGITAGGPTTKGKWSATGQATRK